MKRWQKSRFPESGGKKRGEIDRNYDGACIKTHIEREGEDARKSNKLKEMEIDDRELNGRKVRGRKKQWTRKALSTHP